MNHVEENQTVRRLAAFTLAVAVLTVSACTSSGTADPAGPDAATTTSGTDLSVQLELVATHDESTIPGLEVPGYIAFDSQGQLYIVNSGNSEILVLDSDGRVKRRWGERGTKPGQFDFYRSPTDPLGGIAVAADGSVYVVESGATRVQHLTAKGRPLASWGGTKGQDDGQFLEPIGVAVAPSGEVYVVDDIRDDIQVFSADGTYRRTIGGPGSAPGQLRDTGNIRIDGQGNLLNADFGNGRVQAWDDKGRLLWTLGSKGTGPGQFTEPQDVAFGPDGHLLVVDDGRVQVFNVQRELVGVWPADPSPDHLGALALDGDHLWVEAPYPNKLFELKVSWTS
jgi:DNA-binding beta-propeller fold protein YncE